MSPTTDPPERKKRSVRWIVLIFLLSAFGSAGARAEMIYLNQENITVSLGASMDADPFENRPTADSLASIIDAPNAEASEDHTQSTHVWVSGGPLELDFDFGQEYDLATLHFWNYFAEGFDVDNIDFTFFDASAMQVGELAVAPALGGDGGNPIFAEDIVLDAPLNTRFVNAVLTGSNDEVDFNNLGFTGELSASTPPPPPNAIPTPGALPAGLVLLGGLLFRRRRAKLRRASR